MNSKELFKQIGNIDDELIVEAETAATHPKSWTRKRFVIVAAALCLLICGSVTVSAYSYIQNKEKELYIRYLSSIDINTLENDQAAFNADKFFAALKSGDAYSQYIALNRLVECFNDEELRSRAIRAIEPFLSNEQEKLAAAARFSLDILTQAYESEQLYKLADGSIIFTLFHNYSDYGSYNELWRIQDGQLEKYFTFTDPSAYIKNIQLSPGKNRLAIVTNSNKSEYLVILDAVAGRVSPELVNSARIKHGTAKGYEVWQSIDNETYSGVENLAWANDNELLFDAYLAYNGAEIVDAVSANYDFVQQTLTVTDDKLSQ